MRIRLHVATLHEGEIPLGSLVQADGESGKILLPKLGPRIHAGSGERRSCCKSRRNRFLRGFVDHRALTALLWSQVMVWHGVEGGPHYLCINASWFLQRRTE